VLWHDVVVRKRARRLPSLRAITRVESSGDDEETEAGTGTVPEADGSGEKKLKDNQVQLPMKKRSAEMSFTCNVCQHRTTRMVNPHAFKNGTMFAQCAGCEAWHKIVDNLGLIYEFPKEEA
jgi:protein import protein ZIM17